MAGSSPFREVLGSTVRTDVLLAVAAEPRTTDALKAAVDASESAVYDALGDLERQGVVRSVDDRWEPTGSGRLVADLVESQEDLADLLADDYWRTHDVGALPERFRLRLAELADAEVFRASETDPHAAVREVCERVEAGSPDVDVVSPIYHSEYADAMPDAEEARLVLDTSMVEEAIERAGGADSAERLRHTSVRVLDVDVAVSVTDGHLLLSLPTLGGQYDSRTEVLATDERALAWGRDLFEYYWGRAVPEEEFLARLL